MLFHRGSRMTSKYMQQKVDGWTGGRELQEHTGLSPVCSCSSRPPVHPSTFCCMYLEVIRDPLWNNIRVDPLALRLIDTAAFQRLRYVRQLGLAYLVYPGASHTRFEHALGAYNLARQALGLLEERGLTDGLSAGECRGV